MPVNDLIELATARTDAERAALEAAADTLEDAQERARQARGEIASELRVVQELEGATAELRRELGAEPTPADSAARLEELVGKLAVLGRRRARVRELQRTAAEAGAELRAAGQRRQAAERRLARAEAALAELVATKELRDEVWEAALGEEPLSGAPVRAGELLAALGDRQAEVTGDIPDPLLDAVAARRAALWDWRKATTAIVAAAEEAADKAAKKHGGAEAEAAVEERTYRRRREAVARFVARTPGLLAEAETFVDRAPPVLNDEQKAALADADKQAEREAAADLEEKLREAESAEADALRAKEVAQLTKLHTPSHDAAPAIAAHGTAVAAREQADADFTPEKQETVFAWQAAAPDAVWSYLARLDDLRSRILTVKNAVVADLLADFDEADQKVARALEKADAKRDTTRTIGDRLAEHELRSRALLDGPLARSA